MKLLPQYSIRMMLCIMAFVAGVFSIVGLAARGHDWAIGVSLGVAGTAIALLTYAAFFAILWIFSVVASPLANRRLAAGRRTLAGTSSPFANRNGEEAGEIAMDAILVDESGSTAAEKDSATGEHQP